MISILVGFVSIVLVAGGVLRLYEYTLYAPEQRASVPHLPYGVLGASVLVVLVGLTGAIATAADTGLQSLLVVLPVVSALPALLQHRLNRPLGIERSPLTARTSERWR